MVKKYFKGQVKIADVKEAFDDIVKVTNTVATVYNASKAIEDIDYTKGGTTLAPSGYTLTVGGFKQALSLADRCVVGAKPILIGNNQAKLTAGVLITKTGVHRLPDSIVTKPEGGSSKRTLYYDVDNKAYTWTPKGETETVVVRKNFETPLLNKNADNEYLNNTHNDWCKLDATMLEGLRGRILNPSSYGRIDQNPGGVYWLTVAFKNTNAPTGDVWENTTESIRANGSIKLPIESYPCIYTDPLREGDKVRLNCIEDGVNTLLDTIGYGLITFGHIDKDSKTFTPKFAIEAHADAYQEALTIGLYTPDFSDIKTRVNPVTGQAGYSIDGLDYQEIEICMNRVSYASKRISFGSITSLTYTFGKKVTTEEPCIDIRITFNDGTYQDWQMDLPQDISKYDVNCVMNSITGWSLTDKIVNQILYPSPTTGTTIDPAFNNYLGYWFTTDVITVNGKGIGAGQAGWEETQIISTDGYKVCDIDFKSSSKMASVLNNCQNEAINGTFKITSQSRWVKPVAENTPTDNVVDTTNNPLFVAAIEQIGLEGNPTTTTKLLGHEVSYTRPLHHRDLDTWTPINFLFVPRGVSNPYSVTPANRDFTHKFGVIINKNIKE